MPIELLDAEALKLVCAYLPSLMDAYFEREHILTDKGLQAFKPALRFIEEFCESSEELEEFKNIQMESKKVWQGGLVIPISY